MSEHDIRRDFGETWKERLAEARERAASPGPRLSSEDIARLQAAVADIDVTAPDDMALLWSGRGILTGVSMDEEKLDSPVWWDTLACRITTINGLDRGHFPSEVGAAFALLRRWDVERSRRYREFIATASDASPHERTTATDDYREIQLWYEQDFFEELGPHRELPSLPVDVVRAADRSMAANGWKYSAAWRAFIRAAGAKGGVAP